MAVETEGDAGFVQFVLVFHFFGRGLDGFHGGAGDDVAEVLGECGEDRGCGWAMEADDELVMDEAAGVEVAVEAGDPADGFGGVLGDLVEVEVVFGDQRCAEEVFTDVAVPGFPVGASGSVDEDEGHELAFACLHEGEGFIGFVHGSEATGEEGDGVGVADEREFPGEEVLEGDEFFVLEDDGVGGLFPGQPDIGAEAVFGSGSLVACLHDSRAGTGDDHEAGLGGEAAEFLGLVVFGFIGLGAGGAEDSDLALVVIGGEEAEGVAEFTDGGLDDSDIPAMFDVGEEFQGVLDDIGDEVGVMAAAAVLDEFLDEAGEFGVGGGGVFAFVHVG